MDWKSLSSSYLPWDKSYIVDRWHTMSDYFIPVNNMEVEYDDGMHVITIYKIKKGSVFYHGSGAKIKDFDRIAFFSPHAEISKMILSLLAKGLIHVGKNDTIQKKKAYLYQFRTKRDLHVVYNRNMGLGAGYTGQFSPFLVNQPIPTFCAEYSWLDGFVSFRDAAPFFPLFRLNEGKTSTELVQTANRLKNSNSYFFQQYLRHGSGTRNDPVYTAEYVFCQPREILEWEGTELLDMPTLFRRWKHYSIKWLEALATIPRNDRPRWILEQKYNFILGPVVPEPWRIYHDKFFMLHDRIVDANEVDLSADIFTQNIHTLSEETVYRFWIGRGDRWDLKIAKKVLPVLIHTHPKATMALLLTMCKDAQGQKKKLADLKTLFHQLV